MIENVGFFKKVVIICGHFLISPPPAGKNVIKSSRLPAANLCLSFFAKSLFFSSPGIMMKN